MEPRVADIEASACPECGTRISERGVPRPGGWTSWRHVAPVVCVVGMLVAMGAAFWSGRGSYASRPGRQIERRVEFVAPICTLGDVERAANGDPAPIGLARALMERSNEWLVRPPGEEYLRVCFHPGDGTEHAYRSFGWPSPVVMTTRSTEFLDARTGAGLPAEVMERARKMYGETDQGRHVSFDGGYVFIHGGSGLLYQQAMVTIDLKALGGLVMLPVIAWYVAGWGAGAAARGREAAGRRAVVRWSRRIAAVLMVIALAAVGVWMPTTRIVRTPDSYSVTLAQHGRYSKHPASAADERVTTITYRQIEALAGEPDGDRRLAARIMSESGSPPRDWYLCAAFSEDSVRGGEELTWDWPWRLLEVQSVQRWRDGVPVSGSAGRAPSGFGAADRITWPAAGPVARLRDGQLQVALPRAAPTQELRAVMIDVGGVLFGAVLLWVAWVTGRAVCERRARVLTARRAAANQCVACGYSLAGVADEVR